MTAMSNVLPSVALPSLAVVQSWGTVTVPHSNVMPLGATILSWRAASFASDRQSRQAIPPSAAVAPLSFHWTRSPVPPATTTAMAVSVAMSPTRQRTNSLLPRTTDLRLRGAGQDIVDVEPDRPVQLLIGARPRRPVRSPTPELCRVPEPLPGRLAFHGFVPHLGDQLGTQRLPGEVLLAGPAADRSRKAVPGLVLYPRLPWVIVGRARLIRGEFGQ